MMSDNMIKDLDLITMSKMGNSPIELSMIMIDELNDEREIIANKHIEWRFTLVFGSVKINLELTGQNSKTKVAIGILQVSH